MKIQSHVDEILEMLIQEDQYKTFNVLSNLELDNIINTFSDISISKESVSIENPWGWNGKQLFVGNLNACGVCHEIAHFLVSPTENRKYINFGLGFGFNDIEVPPSDQFVFNIDVEFEEKLACLLEWELMYLFGYKDQIKSSMTEEGFGDGDVSLIENCYKELFNRNLLLIKK